jgi:nicotinate-nucleotide pyrophosphorylase (carboxylating)
MDDIDRFIAEDLGSGDVTTKAVSRGERLSAVVVCRERCVVAGLSEAKEVFERLGASAKAIAEEGAELEVGQPVMDVGGAAEAVLSAERVALNIVMRMSGIATKTRRLVDLCKKANPNVRVAATRKTTPGFRRLEKRAVVVGGGHPHREGLYDMVLVKDNHVILAGGAAEAARRAKTGAPLGMRVEVEVTTMEEATDVAAVGVDVILIDNASPEEGARIAAEIRRLAPATEIEASGGITEANAASFASWADVVSIGSLTHSCKSCDFSLEVIKVLR